MTNTRDYLASVDLGTDRDIRESVKGLTADNIERDLKRIDNRQSAIDFRAEDEAGILRMIMSAVSTLEEFGVQAYFLARDANGVPTFWVDADDGSLAAINGNYKINAAGELISGLLFASLHTATLGAYTRNFRRGFVDAGTGKPVFRLEFYSTPSTSNKVLTNPGIETGSLATGFSANTNWAATTEAVASGTYSAKSSSTDPLTINKYGVTALNYYRLGVKLRRAVIPSGAKVEAKWYDATPTLKRTDTIASSAGGYGSFIEAFSTLQAPVSATQVEIIVTPLSASSAIYADDFSIYDVDKYGAIEFGDDGVFVLTESKRVDVVNVFPFGPGTDGDVVISADTHLTRDMYYNDLTINSTKTLYPDGFRIFVAGTLTNNGTIQQNGANGSAGTTTTPGAGGASATSETGYTLFPGMNGATSGAVASSGTSNGAASSNDSSSVGLASPFIMRSGGGGGSGACHGNTAVNGVKSNKPFAGLATGGDGGAGSGANSVRLHGGGGGAGGGIIEIWAKTINNAGTISANGGNGGDGATGGAGPSKAGNGGGGGGGTILIYYRSTTGSGLGTRTVTAGNPGSAGNGGVAGGVGTSGAYQI